MTAPTADHVLAPDAGGRVSKKLHIWAALIFAVVIGAAVTWHEFRKPQQNLQKAAQEKAKIDMTPPNEGALTTALDEQRKAGGQDPNAPANSGINGAAATPGGVRPQGATQPAPVPPAGQAGVTPGSPQAAGYPAGAPGTPGALGGRTQDERFNDGVMANSSILVLSDANNLQAKFLGDNGKPPAGNIPMPAPGINSAEIEKLMTAGMPKPSAPAPKPQYEKNKHEEWMESIENEKAKPPIEDDGLIGDRVVAQGTIIPVILMTAINSDLPGDIVARTTADVYDTVRQSNLLIPAGTSFFGKYSTDVDVGQERMPSAFARMLMPNGRSVRLGAMPGVDSTGQSGLPGEVNNHFIQSFGASFLVAGLSALFDRNQNPNVTVNLGSSAAGGTANNLTNSTGQILVDLTKRITDRNSKRNPSLTVQPGIPFNVMVQRDIRLPPYVRGAR